MFSGRYTKEAFFRTSARTRSSGNVRRGSTDAKAAGSASSSVGATRVANGSMSLPRNTQPQRAGKRRAQRPMHPRSQTRLPAPTLHKCRP